MESQRCSRRPLAVSHWPHLPTELIEIVTNHLPNPYDIIRFRSVCRSWRFSISIPPRFLSPFFPLTISFPRKDKSRPIRLVASAVHLLRSHRDPSKARLVYIQEFDSRRLLLRHPLTNEKIAVNSIDSSEWSITPIATSYGYNTFCGGCKRIDSTEKVDVVRNLQNQDPEAVALWIDHWNKLRIWKFSLGARRKTVASQSFCHQCCEIEDFVKFNETTFYAIDTQTSVYVFELNNMQLNRLECDNVVDCISAKSYRKRLVVSDGHLYMVLRFRPDFDHPPECLIYKLMNRASCWQWERVEDLGDRVFFINRDVSFWVWAQDLPRPWKGNSVILEMEGFPFCGCFKNDNEIEVFHFGVQLPQYSLMSMLDGYSDLFAPPY